MIVSETRYLRDGLKTQPVPRHPARLIYTHLHCHELLWSLRAIEFPIV